jgi:Membrane proteins related to metalloendopeptidases
VTYKAYINKNYKPFIRHERECSAFGKPAINRILAAVTLCIFAGLILGMRLPDLSVTHNTRHDHSLPSTNPGNTAETGSYLVSGQTLDQLDPPAAIPLPEVTYTDHLQDIESAATPPFGDSAATETAETWEIVTIQPDDNLSLIFKRKDVSLQDLDSVMSLGKDTAALKKLMPGDELRLRHAAGRLEALEYEINLTDTIRVEREGQRFIAETVSAILETKVSQASSVITDSLFLAAQRSGLSDNLTMQLIELFGWDIDFALDIRNGDQFFIVYEERFRDGVKVQDGQILAAEFINQDKHIRAVRYTHADGYSSYYNDAGFSMRKTFLRTPVNFTRISSRFSLSRKHPILNTIRAHKGVDYAAPIGTPVKATADGIVAFAGSNGGYGREIILRHGEKYNTVYGHLSKYARGISAGKRIKQGQIIGYVGMSGLATGPHLHYEFQINGVHHNPLNVELPKAMGIPENEKNDFLAQTRPLFAQLDVITGKTQQASADYKPVIAQFTRPDSAIR